MHLILAIIAIPLSLLLVIGIHELGHALAAHWFKISIKSIAIGFGRPLCRWQDHSGREWIWGLWPLGGYVHLLNTRITPVARKDLPLCFDKKPIWIRIIVLVSGAGANILMAWVALTTVFLLGYPQTEPVIASVQAHSIAAQAHVQPGDKWIAIAHHPTPSWQVVGMQLLANLGHAHIAVTVCGTTGQYRHLSLDLTHWQSSGQSRSLLSSIGIEPDNSAEYQRNIPGIPLVSAIQQTWVALAELIRFYMITIKQLITGKILFLFLLGPVSILMTMIDSFLQGLVVFLLFISHLSLAVALVNLLPVPTLDGGSIVYALLEKVRGKPISIALELLLHRLIFIALSVLFINLVLNDLQRYFG